LAQVAADEFADVHRSLHYLLLRLQSDLDSALKDDTDMLTEAGAAMVARHSALAYYDLRYNPRRYFSWDALSCELLFQL
jgi:hypothetical protein